MSKKSTLLLEIEIDAIYLDSAFEVQEFFNARFLENVTYVYDEDGDIISSERDERFYMPEVGDYLDEDYDYGKTTFLQIRTDAIEDIFFGFCKEAFRDQIFYRKLAQSVYQYMGLILERGVSDPLVRKYFSEENFSNERLSDFIRIFNKMEKACGKNYKGYQRGFMYATYDEISSGIPAMYPLSEAGYPD